MVKTCCVRNCDVGAKEATFFKFPTSRLLKRQWIDAIGLSSKLTANSSICSRHFQQDDYDVVRGKPRLRARVVPSLFGAEKDPETESIDSENKDSKDNIIPEECIAIEESSDVPDNVADETTEDNVKVEEKPVEKRVLRSSKEVDKGALRNKEVSLRSKGEALRRKGQAIRSKGGSLRGKVEAASSEGEASSSKREPSSSKGEELSSQEEASSSKAESLSDKEDRDVIDKKIPEDGVREKKNGVDTTADGKSGEECVTSTPEQKTEDLTEDIEEIITNYQIKQTRPLHTQVENRTDDSAAKRSDEDKEREERQDREDVEVIEEDREVIEIPDDGKQTPVFIELSIPERGNERAGSPRDCLMVLESVQVDVDPSSLLADDDDRREDPISLLTSSDEDEVIIQEPHIDTVEVSDETDDDDLPLVRLLKRTAKTKKTSKGITTKQLAKFMWGVAEYYCMQCHFTSSSPAEFRLHASNHSTILQVCQVCDYTSASKTQFARHKRKHKDDKRYRCHLCDYKARHNMSLIYHLKSHERANSSGGKKGFKCDECGFKSDVKADVLKHVRACSSDVKKFKCDKCEYETKRSTDLNRHKERRHKKGRGDDDYRP